VYNCG
jgi:Suppressor of fused protein (SUFU)